MSITLLTFYTIHLPLSYQSLIWDLVINPPRKPPTLGSRTDPPMMTHVCGMVTYTPVSAIQIDNTVIKLEFFQQHAFSMATSRSQLHLTKKLFPAESLWKDKYPPTWTFPPCGVYFWSICWYELAQFIKRRKRNLTFMSNSTGLVDFAVALVWILSFTCPMVKWSIFGIKFETLQIITGVLYM